MLIICLEDLLSHGKGLMGELYPPGGYTIHNEWKKHWACLSEITGSLNREALPVNLVMISLQKIVSCRKTRS